MSSQDWNAQLLNLAYYAGQLAARGDQHVALAQARELTDDYKRRVDSYQQLASPLSEYRLDPWSKPMMAHDTPLVSDCMSPPWMARHATAVSMPVDGMSAPFEGPTLWTPMTCPPAPPSPHPGAQRKRRGVASKKPLSEFRVYTKESPCPSQVAPSGSYKPRPTKAQKTPDA